MLAHLSQLITFKLLMPFVLIQAMLNMFREAFYARCFVPNMIDMTIFLLLKMAKIFSKDFRCILYQALKFH